MRNCFPTGAILGAIMLCSGCTMSPVSTGTPATTEHALTFDEYATYVTQGDYQIYVRYHDELTYSHVLNTDYQPGADSFSLDASAVIVVAVPSFETTGKFMKMRLIQTEGALPAVESVACSRRNATITATCTYPPSSRVLEDDYEIYLSDDLSPTIADSDPRIPSHDEFIKEDMARIGKTFEPERAEISANLRTLNVFDVNCFWTHVEWADFYCRSVSEDGKNVFETEYFRSADQGGA